jgi:hypothetical protein
MNQKLINCIKDRILFCFEREEFGWMKRGNIIEVMRNDEFKTCTFNNCISVAEIFNNQLGNDVFIGLLKDTFDQAYLVASRTIESTTLITINPSKELKSNKEEITWLDESKIQELGWDTNNGYRINSYRTRYFEYLEHEKGWKQDVLDDVKKSSLKVVKNIGNPQDTNAFFIRGMVLGSVQSGKTTNFNAVINSAIDLGYQLIIVFCGTIEDLRRQTYQRISTEVVGGWEHDVAIKSRTGKDYKGVSNIYNFGANERQVNLITGPNNDFNAIVAANDFNPDSYNIAICKKNVSIIKNLLQWLDQYRQARNLPVLIIDDECDNASLNNNGNDSEANASQINAGIRALLNMFSKKTYLGYTATPFANILQFDGNQAKFSWTKGVVSYSFDCCKEDLFPDDFIQLLSPPSNYVGIKDFFDTREPNREKIIGLIETIPSPEINECFPLRVLEVNGSISGTASNEIGTRASKKDDPFPSYLPNSLKDAIKCFILSIALRYSRKDEQEHFPLAQKHHSMLIHISRYTNWIDKTKKLIEDYIDKIEPAIREGDVKSNIYIELERAWNNYFLTQVGFIANQLSERKRNDPYLTIKDFDTIRKYLPSAIRGISIVSIHSGSNDELKYNNSNGNKYIALGGNALSRGFTMEGLSISYFVRGTTNADTLMQMGRWFGYRPGYLDACKLFTSKEALRKFDEASVIIEDLENKLDEMINECKSPKEFTIWIQDNPDVLRLTRPNLLRNLHELTLDFNDKLQQSTHFHINRAKIENYYHNFKNFIKSINTGWEVKRSFIIKRNVPSSDIIEALKIGGLKDVLINFNIAGLDNFIKKANQDRTLQNWTIALSLTIDGENKTINLKNEFGIDLMPNSRLIKRSRANNDNKSLQLLFDEDIFKSIKSTIISPSDMGISFDDETNEQIREDFFKHNPGKLNVPESSYRRNLSPNEGVLIFYMIDPTYIIGQRELISSEFLNSYDNFILRNNLEGFDTPIIGCAVGLPVIQNSINYPTTYNYVTRKLIKMPIEMVYSERVKAAGSIGTEINKANDIGIIIKIKDRLKLDFEYSDKMSIRELKELLLLNYLENGSN